MGPISFLPCQHDPTDPGAPLGSGRERGFKKRVLAAQKVAL